MKRLTVILFVLCLIVPAVAQTWQIESVDSEDNVGRYTSVALDSSGNPHISYYDHTNRDLKYARWDGSAWQIETVDSEGMVGEYTSLALDSSDNPHISYFYGYPDNDLKYASWDGSAWQIETLDSEGDVGYHTSLALDSSDNPHISYWDRFSNYDLKYANWDGSSWQIEIVDSSGKVGTFNSLALDSSGNPHISYYDDSNKDLKYANWDGSAWQTETVDSEGNVGIFTSLTLDSLGNPHISYYDTTNVDLKYASWDGSAWQTEVADSEGCEYTSLALDSSDNPYIAYRERTSGDIKYTGWDGSAWQIETVDSEDGVFWYVSLALDSSDSPYVSYCDYNNGDLKYARLSTGPAAFSLLSPAKSETVNDWPLCDWEDTTGPPDLSYGIWYSTDSSFVNYSAITGLADSCFQFSDAELNNDTTYYWKIVASSGNYDIWSTETDWWFHVVAYVGVESVDLSANSQDEGVLLSWSILGDEPASVSVLRGLTKNDTVALSGELSGSATSWLDVSVEAGVEYAYYLEVTELDGTVSRFGPSEVVVPGMVSELALSDPYPNPADESLTIHYELTQNATVKLHIYDVAGRLVETLVSGEQTAGRHSVRWDSSVAATGVYLLRLEVDGEAITKRAVISR